MKALLLSFLLIFGVRVALTIDDDFLMLVIPVVVFVLGSKAPRGLGIFLILISPTVGFSYNGGPSLPVYIAGGFFVCWGLYNIFVLGKSSYTYRQVLLHNIAIPLVAAALTFWDNWLL